MSEAPKLSIQVVAEILGQSRQAVHSNLKKKGIERPKVGRTAYITHSIAKELFGARFEQTKIAVQHIKGGVGKTTTTDVIGDAASLLGARVLKIDADFQKNLTIRYGIPSEVVDNTPVLIDFVHGDVNIEDSIINVADGIDLMPSRFENANLDSAMTSEDTNLETFFEEILQPIAHRYDVILIDCPAMLGKLVSAIAMYTGMFLCPINPDEFSIEGLKILKKEIERINQAYPNLSVNYLTFLNMFEPSTILSNQAVNDTMRSEINEGHGLDIIVKRNQEVKNAQRGHYSLFDSLSPLDARDDFLRLTRKLLSFNDLLSITRKSD